ncbi:unnamed protein product [Arctia plantaginis]|uniref:Uncharacterized protein n=1 Tax=Arctia plantaginis TaxID=874455 RepID=A0A8S1AHC4_ARCPL|nr:unnamed protein product [Arctia plantaginis]CAB3253561.1 unnamed protein product [Arctia plantaginis]
MTICIWSVPSIIGFANLLFGACTEIFKWTDFADNNQILEQETTDVNVDKDEDTDGISIISDSEPDTSAPCELILDKYVMEENRPAELPCPQFISFNPLPPNSNTHEEVLRSQDDFLGHTAGKHKTYVHRRNKRLSTVLNIIMLGSVITAAGVAIGHMWGARNECSMHTSPSINKILSNLYKLQEENTYLRNKLKELTLVSSTLQIPQKKLHTFDKTPYKQQRCKKVYEEPLHSKNIDKITKCIDRETTKNIEKELNNHLVQPDYEKEFVRDVDKLTQIYQQNRSWLDDEIAKRMKHEEKTIEKMIKSPLSSITEEQRVLQDDNIKTQSDMDNYQPAFQIISPEAEQLIQIELDSNNDDIPAAKKITYADSLKSEQQTRKVQKRDVNAAITKENKHNIIKKKGKEDKDVVFIDVNFSEEEFKKDDRYVGQKHKQERKKRDRQKLHKKQKRRNKYEQWEMKGGYMKDYDDFSITSFQENENPLKKLNGHKVIQEIEKTNNTNQLLGADSSQNINLSNNSNDVQNKKHEKDGGKNSKIEDTNWYDKRAALRTEARKRLQHELFGETSPNNAGWYFRRMHKREQCRAKSDNSTYKKLSKRNMNFKMKK